ncbi:hypothetical protein F5883DRAFT_565497 [Diaporthe sp. PMI_573]|nr:hypothetical protein F5883DRAFT_565497 [Diaporthaceae sp. PMI_573]
MTKIRSACSLYQGFQIWLLVAGSFLKSVGSCHGQSSQRYGGPGKVRRENITGRIVDLLLCSSCSKPGHSVLFKGPPPP